MYQVHINTEVFEEDYSHHELAKLLRWVADQVELHGVAPRKILDPDGNTVGTAGKESD